MAFESIYLSDSVCVLPCGKGRNHWCMHRKCCNICIDFHLLYWLLCKIRMQKYPTQHAFNVNAWEKAHQIKTNYVFRKMKFHPNQIDSRNAMSIGMLELRSETINLHSQKYSKQENCQLFLCICKVDAVKQLEIWKWK